MSKAAGKGKAIDGLFLQQVGRLFVSCFRTTKSGFQSLKLWEKCDIHAKVNDFYVEFGILEEILYFCT
jgi:hypothetical protein